MHFIFIRLRRNSSCDLPAFLLALVCLAYYQNDCNCALSIEPTHVKSLMRRATALNALGRHRAATRDLIAALAFEPGKLV
jgi:hypothetical protein